MIGVGLYGLGRLGRSLFRRLYPRDDVRLLAVHDPAEPAALEYLLRFDTRLGRLPERLSAHDGRLYVAGREISFLAGKDAPEIPPWGDLGVHTVLDATGAPRTRRQAEEHLAAGARRFIALGPTGDAADATVVIGVNEDEIDRAQRFVSAATATVHCVAPVASILADAFGIRRAVYTAVHSYGSAHHLADVPAEDERRGRAAAENIIPQDSRSAAVVAALLPGLAGRLTGFAVNVPVSRGSAIDLTCWHEKAVTVEAVNEVLRSAAGSLRWSGVVGYETEPIVSSDVAGSPHSAVVDSLATMTLSSGVSKTLAWYDEDSGYAARAIELVGRYAAKEAEAAA
jgi:glyceraldehyde 3-phosphate dehydrogenase